MLTQICVAGLVLCLVYIMVLTAGPLQSNNCGDQGSILRNSISAENFLGSILSLGLILALLKKTDLSLSDYYRHNLGYM
jgi:hypothetical protein